MGDPLCTHGLRVRKMGLYRRKQKVSLPDRNTDRQTHKQTGSHTKLTDSQTDLLNIFGELLSTTHVYRWTVRLCQRDRQTN